MYLRIIAILVIISMESLAMMSKSFSRTDSSISDPSSSQSAPRDYANKIGMMCSYNLSNPFDHFFMEIGEKDHITSNDTLEKLGKNKKVIFFVNGYGENMNPDHELDGFSFEWFRSFTYGLLKDENTIACAFDFNRLNSMGPVCLLACYWNTVTNRVPFAAKMIKKVAAEMFEKNVTTIENFELIGFSLGAHIAGLTARRIQKEIGVVVPRIFALDPARRIINKSNRKQLQKSDARYIQAIITSDIGDHQIDVHSKVFINDSKNQPGCEDMMPIALQFCSHIYSIDLYKRIGHQTLTLTAYKDPDENVGVPNVPNEMIVGHHSQENACGVFFANTDYSKVKKSRK